MPLVAAVDVDGVDDDNNNTGELSGSDKGKGATVSNGGFSTTISRDEIVPHWELVSVATHEIGHNFGARHDCCTSCSASDIVNGITQVCPGYAMNINGKEYTFDPNGVNGDCVPADASDTGGGYLMYPSVADKDSAYGTSFSSCSAADIIATVNKQGSCLVEPNPCANGGACCDKAGSLLPATTVCRAADPLLPCSKQATCDGIHPDCGANQFYPDDTPCDTDANNAENHGVCHSGVCSHIHAAWCADATNEGFDASCIVPGYECVRSCTQANNPDAGCMYGNRGCEDNAGIFDAFSAHNKWNGYIYWLGTGGDTCDIAAVGTPCVVGGKEDGLCEASGSCKVCEKVGCGNQSTTPNIDLSSSRDRFGIPRLMLCLQWRIFCGSHLTRKP